MILGFRKFIETNEIEEVPPAPGTSPIPPGNVRLYHYINPRKTGIREEDIIKTVKEKGIDISMARGSTYGEPNVVWASTQLPNRDKIYVEFFIPMDDPRWQIGKPRSQKDVDWLHGSGADVNFSDSIKPNEIIAIHLPWHHSYRYLVKNNMISQALEGEFDYLKPDSDEAKAVSYIKRRFGR